MHETILEFTWSQKRKEELRKIAASTNAGIWRIKRAKIILGVLEGKSIERLVLDVRVVPESIIKCLKRFSEEGMRFFDSPDRIPTLREAAVERMLDLLEHPPPLRSKQWNDVKVHYIGRDFSAREIKKIRDLIEAKPERPRVEIVHEICRIFGLYQSNGKFKTTGTSIALKRMDMDNIVALPPVPKKTKRNEAKKKQNVLILTAPESEKTIFLNGHDLNLVVSNARFLILPWIKSANLASRILAGISKQLPIDWEARYNYRPVLLETFVQLPNFQGTCYRAANWVEVGTTKGYGIGKEQKARSTAKAVFLYPLEAELSQDTMQCLIVFLCVLRELRESHKQT